MANICGRYLDVAVKALDLEMEVRAIPPAEVRGTPIMLAEEEDLALCV